MNARASSRTRGELRRSGARCALVALTLIAGVLRAAPAASAADIFHIYDPKSQLVGLVSEDGSAVSWVWDENGNLVSVSKIDASSLPGNVAISLVAPNAAKISASIQVFGKGLANPTSVTFNGVAATVTASGSNYIQTSVPTTATTGLIHVVTPLGEADSPTPFIVVGPMTITPTTAQLPTGGTQTFTASAPATFMVNGIAGGTPELGTITSAISTTATYTAPTSSLPPREVTVAAQSPDDPQNRAEATIIIIPPSVDPTPVVRAPRLSLVVTSANPLPATPLAASRVTVMRGAADLTAVEVSAERQPVITAVSPGSIAQGASNVTLALTGQGLSSPTALQFLRAGTTDTAITVTSLTATGDTQATAVVSVASAAVVGLRVLQVTASGASSTAAGAGGNVLQVIDPPTFWWNSAWHYRKSLTITAGADALPADYSVKRTFDHGAQVAVGKSLASGDDVRLTYWNGTSEVPLDRVLGPGATWNQATTTLWFKLSAALAAFGSDANYFLYYGNPAPGSPPANPDVVFQLYDDFSGSTLNAAKWVAVTSGAVTVAPTGGALQVSGTTDASNAAQTFGIRSVATFTGNVAMESTFSIITQSATAWANWKAAFGLGLDSTGLGVHSTASTNKRVQYWNGTAWVDLADSTLDTQTFSAQQVRQTLRSNGTAQHYESGTLKASRTGVSTAARSLVFQYGPDQPNESFDVRFDTLIVRKYVASDGSIALSLGSEVAR